MVASGDVLLPLAIVGVAIVLFSIGAAQQRKRRLLLGGWAVDRGFRYSPDRDEGMDHRYPGLRALQEGRSRYAYNVMRGTHDGRPCCAFDYHYVTGSGKSQTTHHLSMVILDTGLPVKPLFLRPETVLDRIPEFFGIDDIDFESTEFSRAFHVRAPDRRWAFDVLHQGTMEFLLRSPRFAVELAAPFAAAWDSGEMSVRRFEDALRVLDGILDRLPRYVHQDLSGGRKE